MNNKIIDFNKLISMQNKSKNKSSSITCAKYDYIKKENNKKVIYQYTTKLISNIDVPYKRYKLQ